MGRRIWRARFCTHKGDSDRLRSMIHFCQTEVKMARFDLSDVEWRLIKPLLPNKPRGVARVDDRRVLNGIFYVLRTGSPWRDLPERYGPYTTVYNRFNRWARAGVWVQIFETLAAKSKSSLHLIDSTIVEAHRAASGAKGGSKIRR